MSDEKRAEQLKLQQEIIEKTNINIVTCGNCGGTVLHRIETDLEEIECCYCDLKSDPCDFPDLNY